MTRFLFTCLLTGLLLIAPDAFAERRMALVIGNSDYLIGPLGNPANDASLMAEVLQETGFEVTHHTDLGYRNLQRAVVGFSRQLRDAGEDTVGLVYYAGHAVQANGENYLIPVDAEIEDSLDLEIQTLEASTLMASLERAGNRLNIVVLDACRNNPFKAISRSAGRGLAKIEAPFGTLLAFSTAPGDVATDGSGRNSPYTAALARAMQEPGLPVEQVFKKVRVAVMERTGNQQIPWESSSLTGDFYFRNPVVEAAVEPSTPPPVDNTSAELEYWRSISSSSDPALFRAYLDAYPEGLFNGIAQQRIIALESSQQAGAAQAAWNAVKDSGDPAMLQTMIDRYPSTVYAELAQVKIQSIQNQQAAADLAARQSSAADAEAADRLFWESIKNSPEKSDYQAYLDQFPDGTFATIAQTRAVSGYTPQVASLPPQQRLHPLDGRWEITWEVLTASMYIGNNYFCRGGEVGSGIVEVTGGRFKLTLESNLGGSGNLEGNSNGDTAFQIAARGTGWRNSRLSGRVSLDGAQMSGTLINSNGQYCTADVTMVRVSQ